VKKESTKELSAAPFRDGIDHLEMVSCSNLWWFTRTKQRIWIVTAHVFSQL